MGSGKSCDRQECPAVGTSFKWAEAFSVGHDELDHDHRRLVQAINNICDKYRAGQPATFLHSLLNALETETEKHFKNENVAMLEIYNDKKQLMPDEVRVMTHKAIRDHIAEHNRTLSRLRALIRAASPRTADAATSLCMELREWFIEHAVKYDSQLKSIFQAL